MQQDVWVNLWKRGLHVGKTKRGKGTELMEVADGKGAPLGISTAPASPAEVTLVNEVLATISIPRCGPGRPRTRPPRLIGDKAYDSDPLRDEPARRGIELIAPHRRKRVRGKTQDGRALRRYKRRWIIERTNAWIGSFRRLATRYDRNHRIFLAFAHIACAMIALRGL